MTLEEIEEYKQIKGIFNLLGYTSTSLDKETALKFAWENADTVHQKVLF